VTLLSNLDDREFAIDADLNIYGDRIPFEAYINRDRIAMRSSRIDNNFYGVRFSTIRNDITSFGNLVGLSNSEMDEFCDMIEMLESYITMGSSDSRGDEFDAGPYERLITKLISSVEIKTGKERIDSAGSSVRCTKMELTIPEDAIIKFVSDFYDIFADDEWIKDQFLMTDNSYAHDMFGTNMESLYRDMLSSLRDVARLFERDYSGDINLTFFIGRGNRLMRIEGNWDIKSDNNRVRLTASLDLGSTINDRWTLNLGMSEGNNRGSVRIVWSYTEKSSTIENKLTITPSGGDPVTLTIVWSPSRGDFTLAYEDRYDELELTGYFKFDNRGFDLEIDDFYSLDNYDYSYYYSRPSLFVGISVNYSARIDQIQFINIDRWDQSFVDKVEDVFGSSIGGSSDTTSYAPAW